jgi:TonB family protein
MAVLFGLVLGGCETTAVKTGPANAAQLGSLRPLNPFTDESEDKMKVPISEMTGVSVIPVVRNRVDVRYPTAMRKSGIQGAAVVDFIVDEAGAAREVHAVQATNSEFAAAAVNSVAQWRFKPGEKNGQPVRTHMQVPISFSLNDP